MARKHKYSVGKVLSDQAMEVHGLTVRAWRKKDQQLQLVRELVDRIDDLKLTLQLGKDVNAFGSFAEFEAIVRLVDEVGKQSGGWLKRLHSKSQNAAASIPSEQRAPILSSRAAPPMGATP
jgi:hypothetical protein